MKRENHIVGPCVLCDIQLQWCCTGDYGFFLVWRDACKLWHKMSHEAISPKIIFAIFSPSIYIRNTLPTIQGTQNTLAHTHSKRETHNTLIIRKVFRSTTLNRWITKKNCRKLFKNHPHTFQQFALFVFLFRRLSFFPIFRSDFNRCLWFYCALVVFSSSFFFFFFYFRSIPFGSSPNSIEGNPQTRLYAFLNHQNIVPINSE